MISSTSDTLTVGIILLLLFGAICFYLYSRIIQGEKKISLLENILLDLKVATESSMLNIPDQTEALYNTISQSMHSMPSLSSRSAPLNEIDEIDDSDDILDSMQYQVTEEESSNDVNESDRDENDIVRRIMEENNEPLPTPSPLPSSTPTQVSSSISNEVEDKYIEVPNNTIDNEGTPLFVNKVESAYEHMTVKELQSIAKSKGLSVSGMKRAQVIEVLKAYDNAPASIASSASEPMSFEEAFNSGEGGEPVPMDAPGTLMEANFIE